MQANDAGDLPRLELLTKASCDLSSLLSDREVVVMVSQAFVECCAYLRAERNARVTSDSNARGRLTRGADYLGTFPRPAFVCPCLCHSSEVEGVASSSSVIATPDLSCSQARACCRKRMTHVCPYSVVSLQEPIRIEGGLANTGACDHFLLSVQETRAAVKALLLKRRAAALRKACDGERRVKADAVAVGNARGNVSFGLRGSRGVSIIAADESALGSVVPLGNSLLISRVEQLCEIREIDVNRTEGFARTRARSATISKEAKRTRLCSRTQSKGSPSRITLGKSGLGAATIPVGRHWSIGWFDFLLLVFCSPSEGEWSEMMERTNHTYSQLVGKMNPFKNVIENICSLRHHSSFSKEDKTTHSANHRRCIFSSGYQDRLSSACHRGAENGSEIVSDHPTFVSMEKSHRMGTASLIVKPSVLVRLSLKLAQTLLDPLVIETVLNQIPMRDIQSCLEDPYVSNIHVDRREAMLDHNALARVDSDETLVILVLHLALLDIAGSTFTEKSNQDVSSRQNALANVVISVLNGLPAATGDDATNPTARVTSLLEIARDRSHAPPSRLIPFCSSCEESAEQHLNVKASVGSLLPPSSGKHDALGAILDTLKQMSTGRHDSRCGGPTQHTSRDCNSMLSTSSLVSVLGKCSPSDLPLSVLDLIGLRFSGVALLLCLPLTPSARDVIVWMRKSAVTVLDVAQVKASLARASVVQPHRSDTKASDRQPSPALRNVPSPGTSEKLTPLSQVMEIQTEPVASTPPAARGRLQSVSQPNALQMESDDLRLAFMSRTAPSGTILPAMSGAFRATTSRRLPPCPVQLIPSKHIRQTKPNHSPLWPSPLESRSTLPLSPSQQRMLTKSSINTIPQNDLGEPNTNYICNERTFLTASPLSVPPRRRVLPPLPALGRPPTAAQRAAAQRDTTLNSSLTAIIASRLSSEKYSRLRVSYQMWMHFYSTTKCFKRRFVYGDVIVPALKRLALTAVFRGWQSVALRRLRLRKAYEATQDLVDPRKVQRRSAMLALIGAGGGGEEEASKLATAMRGLSRHVATIDEQSVVSLATISMESYSQSFSQWSEEASRVGADDEYGSTSLGSRRRRTYTVGAEDSDEHHSSSTTHRSRSVSPATSSPIAVREDGTSSPNQRPDTAAIKQFTEVSHPTGKLIRAFSSAHCTVEEKDETKGEEEVEKDLLSSYATLSEKRAALRAFAMRMHSLARHPTFRGSLRVRYMRRWTAAALSKFTRTKVAPSQAALFENQRRQLWTIMEPDERGQLVLFELNSRVDIVLSSQQAWRKLCRDRTLQTGIVSRMTKASLDKVMQRYWGRWQLFSSSAAAARDLMSALIETVRSGGVLSPLMHNSLTEDSWEEGQQEKYSPRELSTEFSTMAGVAPTHSLDLEEDRGSVHRPRVVPAQSPSHTQITTTTGLGVVSLDSNKQLTRDAQAHDAKVQTDGLPKLLEASANFKLTDNAKNNATPPQDHVPEKEECGGVLGIATNKHEHQRQTAQMPSDSSVAVVDDVNTYVTEPNKVLTPHNAPALLLYPLPAFSQRDGVKTRPTDDDERVIILNDRQTVGIVVSDGVFANTNRRSDLPNEERKGESGSEVDCSMTARPEGVDPRRRTPQQRHPGIELSSGGIEESKGSLSRSPCVSETAGSLVACAPPRCFSNTFAGMHTAGGICSTASTTEGYTAPTGEGSADPRVDKLTYARLAPDDERFSTVSSLPTLPLQQHGPYPQYSTRCLEDAESLCRAFLESTELMASELCRLSLLDVGSRGGSTELSHTFLFGANPSVHAALFDRAVAFNLIVTPLCFSPYQVTLNAATSSSSTNQHSLINYSTPNTSLRPPTCGTARRGLAVTNGGVNQNNSSNDVSPPHFSSRRSARLEEVTAAVAELSRKNELRLMRRYFTSSSWYRRAVLTAIRLDAEFDLLFDYYVLFSRRAYAKQGFAQLPSLSSYNSATSPLLAPRSSITSRSNVAANGDCGGLGLGHATQFLSAGDSEDFLKGSAILDGPRQAGGRIPHAMVPPLELRRANYRRSVSISNHSAATFLLSSSAQSSSVAKTPSGLLRFGAGSRSLYASSSVYFAASGLAVMNSGNNNDENPPSNTMSFVQRAQQPHFAGAQRRSVVWGASNDEDLFIPPPLPPAPPSARFLAEKEVFGHDAEEKKNGENKLGETNATNITVSVQDLNVSPLSFDGGVGVRGGDNDERVGFDSQRQFLAYPSIDQSECASSAYLNSNYNTHMRRGGDESQGGDLQQQLISYTYATTTTTQTQGGASEVSSSMQFFGAAGDERRESNTTSGSGSRYRRMLEGHFGIAPQGSGDVL